MTISKFWFYQKLEFSVENIKQDTTKLKIKIYKRERSDGLLRIKTGLKHVPILDPTLF